MHYSTTILRWIKQLPPIAFILLFFSMSYIAMLPIFILYGELFGDVHTLNQGPNIDGSIQSILMIVIVAPIVETYIFQGFLINKLYKSLCGTKNTFFIATISAVFFGLSHWYNIGYVLLTTMVGYVLAYARIIKIEDKFSILYIIIIHALKNTVAILAI